MAGRDRSAGKSVTPDRDRALRALGGRNLPQGTGTRRVDALVSVVPAHPIARPGLLADDLLDDPGTRGALGRLRFHDDLL